ncbi:unnamed protein product, partial [Pelagomonas calceolata]
PPSLLLGLLGLLLVLQSPSPVDRQRHRRVVFTCAGTTLSRNCRSARGLSCGRVGGVEAVRRRDDAACVEAVCAWRLPRAGTRARRPREATMQPCWLNRSVRDHTATPSC